MLEGNMDEVLVIAGLWVPSMQPQLSCHIYVQMTLALDVSKTLDFGYRAT